MVSLAIVAAFLLLMIVSGLGLVAKDWAKEVGINYAPPSWITLGASDAPTRRRCRPARSSRRPAGPTPGSAFNSTVVDPSRRRDRRTEGRQEAGRPRSGADDNKVVDPLADVMKDIRSDQAGAKAVPVVDDRRATLPFGGDKWGRDIIAKTIKGSETSIFVGLAAAARRGIHRHRARSVRRLLRPLGRRRAELVLQRVQLDSLSCCSSSPSRRCCSRRARSPSS